MNNVQFNESGPISQRRNKGPKGLSGFLIKKGIAKNESQANIIMLVAAVVFIAVIIFQNVSFSSPEPVVDTAAEAY